MRRKTSTRVLFCTLAVLLLVSTVAMAAAPTVVTVPWRGALNLDHETYNGKLIHLKGIARGVALSGATASWTPGDGHAPIAATVNPDATGFDFDLSVTYTYPNSPNGTPYPATLTVCNNTSGANTDCASSTYRVKVRTRSLDVEIDIAIDEGLWWLHTNQVRGGSSDGSWTNSNGANVAQTASSVQAFEINNHFEGNDPNFDPYADTVKRGLRNLFSRLGTIAIGVQTAGDPDSNHNGYGVSAVNASYPPYELGMVVDAVVASKTPNAMAATGPAGSGSNPGILGRTYFDIVQDMVDTMAWGQEDPNTGGYRGGWRYGWNYGSSDSSVAQWNAIGILAARDIWNATLPAFVVNENKLWLTYAKSNNQNYAYDYIPGWGYLEVGSPSGLVQAIMDGFQKTDATYWVGIENNMAANWNSWYRDTSDYYRLFALAKAMRLALPSPIVLMAQGTANQIDWFKADCANPASCTGSDKFGVARTIIRDQNSDGFFNTSYRVSGALNQAWGVIILTGTLHLEPVAVATANPNPGAAGVPIHFDGSGSYHTDPSKSIVLYQWFFSDGGSATGVTADHAFSCASVPCNFTATLQVTDNSVPPLVAATTIPVQITAPPHPPTANAGGPYLACANETFTLDGSKSTDVDIAAFGDSITAYGWELDFAQPLDFDEATTVTVQQSYSTAGKKDIGLRVWDNSKAIFGTADNLFDTNFTTADIWTCGCVQNLAARAKPGKIDVTWTPVAGATSYDIYRSTAGPNTGFAKIASGYVSTYAVYADFGLTNGTRYYYRIVPNGAQVACNGSVAASAKPIAR